MRLAALLLLPALVLPACSATDAEAPAAGGVPAPAPDRPATAQLRPAAGPAEVVPGATAAELAAGASAALFDRAPVVVVAAEDDSASQERAASLAGPLGAPVLLSPAAGAADRAAAEVERLEARAVLAVGPAASTWAQGLDDVEVLSSEQEAAEVAEPPASPPAGTVVLTTPKAPAVAAVATARAAGAEVLTVPGPDPRADPASVRRMAELKPTRVLALGSAFGDSDRFAARAATAATGVELPGGGQLVLAGKRYVALYGHPGSKALGVLGEQGPAESVQRASRLASEYAAVRKDAVVVPTFEIITTVADAAAGPDGDYSTESTLEHLQGYVDAAARSGTYVLLDLQPGYTDFLTQAKRYEQLLSQPHVGLALDPEWRLAPGQRHMRQIGRVGADEVNAVGDWLAQLVREKALPQKMLLLHQFKTFMLEDRQRIVADRDELAVVTQMDGHGAPSTKLETWRVIIKDPPAGMVFGWKNFYDEDSPTLTPARTMAVTPTPVFVSYQ